MNGRLVIVGLIVISLLTVGASIYFRSTVTPFEKSFSSTLSPDGRFKAVRLVVARNAPPPYCEASVSIYLAVYPDSFAEAENSYIVYAALCPTPADAANLPAVRWLSNDAVEITYTPGPQPADASKLRRRIVDSSRAVRVTYVERLPAAPTSHSQ